MCGNTPIFTLINSVIIIKGHSLRRACLNSVLYSNKQQYLYTYGLAMIFYSILLGWQLATTMRRE